MSIISRVNLKGVYPFTWERFEQGAEKRFKNVLIGSDHASVDVTMIEDRSKEMAVRLLMDTRPVTPATKAYHWHP